MTTEWKLVPVEPTERMLQSVNGCSERFPAARKWVDKENLLTYQAMIDAAPEPPSQWPSPRPMSEAPKDKPVLAWWPADKQWVVTWWWSQRSGWFCRGYAPPGKPTHYLPMPPAPNEQEVTK